MVRNFITRVIVEIRDEGESTEGWIKKKTRKKRAIT